MDARLLSMMRLSAVVVALLGVAACDEAGPPGGVLIVTAESMGPSAPDSFRVRASGQRQGGFDEAWLRANGVVAMFLISEDRYRLELEQILPGPRSVLVGSVPEACSAPDHPREVAVFPADTTFTSFTLSCP